MDYLNTRIGRWIPPIVGTIAWGLLLLHKSELPAAFNRYSTSYSVLLTLAAINVALLWWSAFRRVFYRGLLQLFSVRTIIILLLLILSAIFLIDFAVGLPRSLGGWVNVFLVMGILIQAECLHAESTRFTGVFVLASCSLVLTLILLEVGFVLFIAESQQPKNLQQFLRLVSHHKLWTNHVSVEKPAGTVRIMGMSDSFGTYGGVNGNYHYLLQRFLQRDGYPGIEFVNISIAGHEPIHHLDLLRMTIAYAPDIVLHGLFVGNDFAFPVDDKYIYRGVFMLRPRDASRFRPRNFLIRTFIENVIVWYQEQERKALEVADKVVRRRGSLSKARFLQVQFWRMGEWGRKGKGQKRIERILPILDEIRAVAEKGGARYVMVIHPDETQVDDQLRQEIIRTYDVDEEKYDFELPQKLLGAYCLDRGILCLDLLPLFRKREKKKELYQVRDTHYNEAGNTLAASAIAVFLRQNHLVQRESP